MKHIRFYLQGRTSPARKMGWIMHKNFFTALFLAVALSFSFGAVTTVTNAQAQETSIADQVASLLAANPNGGDALASAIASLVLNSADPAAAAQEVLSAVANANAAQKASVGRGFASAQNSLAASGNMTAANALGSAINGSTDQDVKNAYTGAGGTWPVGGNNGGNSGNQAGTGLIKNNTGTGSGSDSTSPN